MKVFINTCLVLCFGVACVFMGAKLALWACIGSAHYTCAVKL